MIDKISSRGALLAATCLLVVLGAFGAYLIGVPGWLVLAVGATGIGAIFWRILRRMRRPSGQKEPEA